VKWKGAVYKVPFHLGIEIFKVLLNPENRLNSAPLIDFSNNFKK
jgi:hypothetical protein